MTKKMVKVQMRKERIRNSMKKRNPFGLPTELVSKGHRKAIAHQEPSDHFDEYEGNWDYEDM